MGMRRHRDTAQPVLRELLSIFWLRLATWHCHSVQLESPGCGIQLERHTARGYTAGGWGGEKAELAEPMRMVGCWLELLARLSLSELVQGLLAAGKARGQHRRARDCEATTWAGSGS